MNELKKISLPGIILVILMVAGGLGYILYQRSIPTPPIDDFSRIHPRRTVQVFEIPDSSAVMPMQKLSPEEMQVLVFPGQDATGQERAEYNALVAKLAKQSSSLDITGCASHPLVMKWSLGGGVVKLRNNDSNPHTIYIGGMKIIVESNTAKEIKPSQIFTRGPGNYGYACDRFFGFSGLFVVTR